MHWQKGDGPRSKLGARRRRLQDIEQQCACDRDKGKDRMSSPDDDGHRAPLTPRTFPFPLCHLIGEHIPVMIYTTALSECVSLCS